MENTLQTKINKDLRELNIKFYHAEKGRSNKGKTHRAGLPDLIIWPGKGRVFFVELKTGENKLTEKQTEFMEWAKESGYPCYVVNSLDAWELVKRIEFKYIAGLNPERIHNGGQV